MMNLPKAKMGGEEGLYELNLPKGQKRSHKINSIYLRQSRKQKELY